MKQILVRLVNHRLHSQKAIETLSHIPGVCISEDTGKIYASGIISEINYNRLILGEFSLIYILKKICDEFSVSPEAARKLKMKDIMSVKKIYCYIARQVTEHSLSRIGELIQKDHSGVIYLADKCKNSPELKTKATEIMAKYFTL